VEITKDYMIAAPLREVWRALTEPGIIARWSGGPVEMSAQAGAGFSLWGGDVHGTNLTVEPPLRLVQEWYGGDWEELSIAEFILEGFGSETHLTLLHTRVPDEAAADFDAGWDDYYLGPMKELLERR
jgi:uncharacterized protein YndB with AHSA1/START domain